MVRAKPERTKRIMEMISEGYSRRAIAAHFGIALSSLQEVITRERSKYEIERASSINDQVQLLDDLVQRAAEIVRMAGEPVTVGKDGEVLYDPDDPATVVRNYGGRLAAMATIKGLLERKAKLLGLDAAAKMDVTGSITYILEGVDLDELS